MEPEQTSILKLIPAIRMIMSARSLKSGSFVLSEELTETDPEKISVKLGCPVSVLIGDPDRMINQVLKTRSELGDYLYLDQLGLLGLSFNRFEIEHKLVTVRKKSRIVDQPESSSVPQIRSLLYNRIIAVTGGAMGFGEGIARLLFGEGANVVLMDINEERGRTVAGELNRQSTPNRAYFIRTDVTDPGSVSGAVYETVKVFSGLDVIISNAGVLQAGGIREMDPETFDFVTRVNYHGYYNCIRAAAPVMQQQNKYAPGNFGDIIQINSKSGLEGSVKNFAYAGSKFAGIGLTQSMAKELIEDRIKVNAICPGNYFEGPLWSDPEKGLFVQYLESGKVPGAKTIEDVRRHYESMVPAGRGCRVEDVVKAIKYVIDQEYETGQAIPVTGGQVMLS